MRGLGLDLLEENIKTAHSFDRGPAPGYEVNGARACAGCSGLHTRGSALPVEAGWRPLRETPMNHRLAKGTAGATGTEGSGER
ncbi:MAG: hypothetical protein ACE141_19450 [Bryobacteraceae bacterium]